MLESSERKPKSLLLNPLTEETKPSHFEEDICLKSTDYKCWQHLDLCWAKQLDVTA